MLQLMRIPSCQQHERRKPLKRPREETRGTKIKPYVFSESLNAPPAPLQCFPFQRPLISAVAFVTMETGLAASLAGSAGIFFHNTDGSRGCSRSASPQSAKSAPRETQTRLCPSNATHPTHRLLHDETLYNQTQPFYTICHN